MSLFSLLHFFSRKNQRHVAYFPLLLCFFFQFTISLPCCSWITTQIDEILFVPFALFSSASESFSQTGKASSTHLLYCFVFLTKSYIFLLFLIFNAHKRALCSANFILNSVEESLKVKTGFVVLFQMADPAWVLAIWPAGLGLSCPRHVDRSVTRHKRSSPKTCLCFQEDFQHKKCIFDSKSNTSKYSVLTLNRKAVEIPKTEAY